MARHVFRTILIILFIWAIWIGYQYHTKFQDASALTEKKTEEFYSLDLGSILKEAGIGYRHQEIEINGRKFWIRWFFEKKDTDTIRMVGKVDFLELLPFSGLRVGLSFNPELKLKYE